ncbi:MAG: hypothetical protein WBD55_04220, partial [Dehalococcoidia bacterium]
ALKQRIDTNMQAINDLMAEGRELRESITDEFDPRPYEEWEQRTYGWLEENAQEFKEQFRNEFVAGGQQWPGSLNNPLAADWVNKIDRRRAALSSALEYFRNQHKVLR